LSVLTVSVCQVEVVRGEPHRNVEHVLELARLAAAAEVDVVLLPEIWNASVPLEEVGLYMDSEWIDGARDELSRIARGYGVNLVAGSMVVGDEGRLFNRSFVYDRRGREIFRYDKLHVYEGLGEQGYISPGSSLGLFELDGVRMGLAICFDLDFPEVCRALALRGAKLVLAPVAWQTEFLYAMRHLAAARALENQVFVVTCNRCDEGSRVSYGGHSMGYGPDGKKVFELSDREMVFRVELDLSYVERIRGSYRVFSARRPSLYRRWR